VPTKAGANLLTPSGRYLMRFRAGRDIALLANHRADLHRVLTEQLPTDVVRTGAEVSGVEQSDTSVTVTYGSQQLAADVLVGAGGIHSAVRRFVAPQQREPRHPQVGPPLELDPRHSSHRLTPAGCGPQLSAAFVRERRRGDLNP
jgi:2-polyprenyl-6-methoxyphenol hydroxylase-like FAD-dependent oxidoreductase